MPIYERTINGEIVEIRFGREIVAGDRIVTKHGAVDTVERMAPEIDGFIAHMVNGVSQFIGRSAVVRVVA